MLAKCPSFANASFCYTAPLAKKNSKSANLLSEFRETEEKFSMKTIHGYQDAFQSYTWCFYIMVISEICYISVTAWNSVEEWILKHGCVSDRHNEKRCVLYKSVCLDINLWGLLKQEVYKQQQHNKYFFFCTKSLTL